MLTLDFLTSMGYSLAWPDEYLTMQSVCQSSRLRDAFPAELTQLTKRDRAEGSTCWPQWLWSSFAFSRLDAPLGTWRKGTSVAIVHSSSLLGHAVTPGTHAWADIHLGTLASDSRARMPGQDLSFTFSGPGIHCQVKVLFSFFFFK
jgi:hypothetical protein